MIIDFNELKPKLIGLSVPRPLSGLSGHAVSGPFEELAYQKIKADFPNNTFRQFEYLNDLFSKNPAVIGVEARLALISSPTIRLLLSRGKGAIKKWSAKSPFEEKQNDTADLLLVKDDFYQIIDIKTRNLGKEAQAPNIISAYKLAQVCAEMIDNQEFNNFTINYIEIDWLLDGDRLVCKDVHFMDLFKSEPSSLYINWAASMQIQFHPHNMQQTFAGTKEQWAKSYLGHFTQKADYHAKVTMINNYVTPFEKYIV